MRARPRERGRVPRLTAVALAATLAGCGVTAPTGGPPGWHLFYPKDHLDEHLLEASSFGPRSATPIQTYQPGTGDPWYRDLTDRSFGSTVVLAGAVTKDHASLSRSGDTLTVDGRASVDGTGGEADAAIGRLEGLTWCYRPATQARGVAFTVSMDLAALSATGRNAEAFAGFAGWGDGGACRGDRRVSGSHTVDAPAPCDTATVEVGIDPEGDGAACLDADTVGAGVTWGAIAGSATGPGGGKASVDVTFTVKATALP